MPTSLNTGPCRRCGLVPMIGRSAADLLVAISCKQAGEHHGGGHRRGAPARELLVHVLARRRERLGADHAAGQRPAERSPPLAHVADLLGVRAGVEVRRILELLVGDRQLEAVAEDPELVLVELLRLVRDVAGLDAAAKGPALDGLGQHDRRRTPELRRGLVGGEHLPVVVAAAAEPQDVVVREVLDHPAQPRVGPEELLPDVRTGGHGVLLELPVHGVVHLLDQHAVDVPGEELVPFPAQITLITFSRRPGKASSSWMTFPLPRTARRGAAGCS